MWMEETSLDTRETRGWRQGRETDEVPANIVPPERFRAELERESRRHARYLSGFALVCIGGAKDDASRLALRDAIETETRRTDVAAELADGTWAVLAVCASDREVEALARRLVETTKEIAGEHGAQSRCFAAVASSGHRRVEAEEIWDALGAAFQEAAERTHDVTFAGWE